MTDRSDPVRDRVEIALDRGTRVMRLLTWTAMFALVCLMLWVVSGMAARAEDPRAAARAIGAGGPPRGACHARHHPQHQADQDEHRSPGQQPHDPRSAIQRDLDPIAGRFGSFGHGCPSPLRRSR
ncbi:MAG: hypothetical protein OXE57_06520 [Alphaproteobacteria bacterium]|nr:hypothetical protein [Alphaproteobacteria bacterium]